MKRLSANCLSTATKPQLLVILAGLVALSSWATLAQAKVVEQVGNLRVTVDGNMTPSKLPRDGMAPVAVSVGGQIATTDESAPPELKTLKIEINRHGRLDSTGLPICKVSKIKAASNGRALAACRSSLVGKGKFFGTITLPGSSPFPIEGNLLVFNGKEHGRPVLLGHIFSPHPFANSFVIPFEISNEGHGAYGSALTANLAKALGKKRSLSGIEMTLSRRYSYKGASRSYISAGCPAPKGVNLVSFPLARTSFSFADGRTLTTVLNRTCRARG
jgi:hypothetical protein